MKNLLKIIADSLKGDERFITGPYTGKLGWIGGNDRIVFSDRPDPISINRYPPLGDMHIPIQRGRTRGGYIGNS